MEEVPKPKDINLRQKRFLKYYLEDPTNAAEAARKAGYAPKSAAQKAAQLLSNPKLLPYLQAAAEGAEENCRLSESDIFVQLEGLVETNMFDLLEVQNGRCVVMKDLNEIPYEYGQFIKKIKETPHGIEVEFYSKERALDLLTKIKGMQSVNLGLTPDAHKAIKRLAYTLDD